MIVPFVTWTGSTLVHRVSADTNHSWIREHMGKYITLLTNCGETLTGQIQPVGSEVVTCLRCLCTNVREASEDS